MLISLAACRVSTGPIAAPPELPEYELPSLTVEPDLTPLDLGRDPLPEGVVAAVDGEPIFEAEIDRLSRAIAETDDPETLRAAALARLVERHLFRAKADQMDVRVTDEQLQHALDEVAAVNGLTIEEFEAEVVTMGFTWEGYRDDVVSEIVEMKVLRIHGILGPGDRDAETTADLRARLIGCMRARAEIQVRDEALALPDNPFELVAEIGEFRFEGDVVLPEVELQEVAKAAAEIRMRLCDALSSAELAVQELYLERGYLEVDVQIPWPTETRPPLTIEGQVDAGRPHVVGTISFDQSAVPRRKRIGEAELRERLEPIVSTGQAATMSALQAAGAEMTRAFGEAGLGEVEIIVDRDERERRVGVNITYRLMGD